MNMEPLNKFFRRFVDERLRALIVKETIQIFRDKQQLFLLTFPPIIQVCLYGCALCPDVQDLRLGWQTNARAIRVEK